MYPTTESHTRGTKDLIRKLEIWDFGLILGAYLVDFALFFNHLAYADKSYDLIAFLVWGKPLRVLEKIAGGFSGRITFRRRSDRPSKKGASL